MNKYSFTELNKKSANEIWSNTINKSCFINPEILNILSYETRFYCGFYNSEPLIFWPTVIDNKNIFIPNNFYYIGPTLTNFFSNLKNHSKINRLKEIIDLGINKLSINFNNISFQTHYTFNDVRPIIWSNKFEISVKYSAIIYPENNYFDSWRTLRKRQIKKIEKLEHKIKIDDTITKKEIIDLASQTIDSKEIDIEKYINVNFFYEILKNNFSKVIALREKSNNKLLSFCYLLEDYNSLNMVYNFALQDWKENGIMQLNINEIIKYSLKKNKILDLNGANSFVGADDKASYGAWEKLYFTFKIKK